jgi:hypothetical protein
MSESSKLPKFIQLAIATIRGDDAKATALKIQAKAIGAFNAQIAVKTAETLDKEEDLELAKDNLAKARMNMGVLITDKVVYLEKLGKAQDKVEAAQDELDNHLDSIEFLKEQLAIVKA